jgi:ribosomal-protein-alanine N-acetyltransferase
MLFFLEKPIYHIFYNHISLVIIQVICEEAEIITLAVDSKRRREGIGYELLKSSIIYLEDLDIKKLFLEVAATNQIALKLYHKIGFTACGLRKGYYGQGTDKKADAIIMSYTIVTKVTKSLKSDKKKLQNL